MQRYYTLLERDKPGSPWRITFGDYDRDTVEAEREEMTTGYGATSPSRLKIIATGASQAAIDAAVAKLNGGVAS
jgi:hypothetical protein